MAIERDDIRAALLRKGFREKANDHWFFYLYVDGKKTAVFTRLSHGSKYKTYSDDLVHKVAQQIGLLKDEFLKFVECTINHTQHVGILKAKGRLR